MTFNQNNGKSFVSHYLSIYSNKKLKSIKIELKLNFLIQNYYLKCHQIVCHLFFNDCNPIEN